MGSRAARDPGKGGRVARGAQGLAAGGGWLGKGQKSLLGSSSKGPNFAPGVGGGGLGWAGWPVYMPSVEKKDGVQHWGSFPAGQTSASDRGTTRNPGVGDGKKGGGLR